MRVCRSMNLGLIFFCAAIGTACAPSADTTVRRMQDLNREALVNHQKGQHAAARDRLAEAVSRGDKANLGSHPMLARSHLNLGVVYVEGIKDHDKGVAEMASALALDPKIKLSRTLATANVRRAFGEARTVASHPVANNKTAPKKTPGAAKDLPPPVVAVPTPVDTEPALPKRVPSAIFCPEPTNPTPETAITIRCATRTGVGIARATLHYRPPGTETFVDEPMLRSAKGWLTATIPASVTGNASIQYYVEGLTSGGKVVGKSGDPFSPSLLLLRVGGGGTKFGPDEPDSELEDDNPLAGIDKEHSEADFHRRPPGTIWIGAAIGTGYGWHPVRTLEFRDKLESKVGFSPGGLIHLLPEIGYQWDDEWAVSLQLRYQLIPEEGSGDSQSGHPAHSATSVIARAYRFMQKGNLDYFMTGNFGVGEGFRLGVAKAPPDLPRNDTVRAGPVVLGPGAGVIYHFNPHLAWTLDTRILLGVWQFAAVLDVATGLQVAF